jgi:hypothetical protein
MNLEYLLLPVGLAVLGVPTAVICGSKMRETLGQPARRHNEGMASLIRSKINWIDLVRGAAGAWLIQKPFQDSVSPQDELASSFLAAQLALLFVGVVAQTLWPRRPARVIGPVFFLTGLTLVLSGPLTGGFALVLGLSCALIFGRLSSVFSLVPVALVGFAFLFNELGLMTAFNAVAFALPAFLAFTFGIRISFVRSVAKPSSHNVAAAQQNVPEVAEVPEMPEVPETAPEADTVIRPDFAHPHALEPVPTRSAAPRGGASSVALPDFLRISEEPEEREEPKRMLRNRIFLRRGA